MQKIIKNSIFLITLLLSTLCSSCNKYIILKPIVADIETQQSTSTPEITEIMSPGIQGTAPSVSIASTEVPLSITPACDLSGSPNSHVDYSNLEIETNNEERNPDGRIVLEGMSCLDLTNDVTYPVQNLS